MTDPRLHQCFGKTPSYSISTYALIQNTTGDVLSNLKTCFNMSACLTPSSEFLLAIRSDTRDALTMVREEEGKEEEEEEEEEIEEEKEEGMRCGGYKQRS